MKCFTSSALAGAVMLAASLSLPLSAQADRGHPKAPRGAAADLAAQAQSQAQASEGRVIVKFREGLGKSVAAVGRLGADGSVASAAVPSAASAALPAADTAASNLGPARGAAATHAATVHSLSQRLGLPLAAGWSLGTRTLALRTQGADAATLLRRLAAQPEVEWVVQDHRRSIRGVVPSDPLYPGGQASATPTVGQWFLRAPDPLFVSATNAVGAWAITTGSPSVTVAVLDTGVRFDHPDLAGKLYPGYDFIKSDAKNTARDGDGRDADASDPGDWNTNSADCAVEDSSWHGTQVSGLVAAATDNGLGIASLGRNVMVLPVRVLGRCGGYDSDIIAGMRWAAGLSADPMANPHPAKVLNLSLGSATTCEVDYRDVINELTAAGVSVVVAAGNDEGLKVNSPANCAGVIAVAGVRHAGSKVGYSNIGPEVAVAAPAGNCVNTGAGEPCLYPLLTTNNSGTTTPGANIYSDSYQYASLGTSFATPLVAGSAALMLSANPGLTPAQIRAGLRATARSFPTTGASDATIVACKAPSAVTQDECYCTTSTCGAGLLDAGQAVQWAANQTHGITGGVASLVAGGTATLGSASTLPNGRLATAWSWRIVSGDTLARIVGASNQPTVVIEAVQPGAVVLELTMMDATGATSTSTTGFQVTPVASSSDSGGGGALGWPWLAGLAAAVWALRRPQARQR